MSGKGLDIMFGILYDNFGVFWKVKFLEFVLVNFIDKKNFVLIVFDVCLFEGKFYVFLIVMEIYVFFYNILKVKEVLKIMNQFIILGKKYGFMYDVNNFYFSFVFIV